MTTKPRKGGSELFYLDEHGNKQDAARHEEILGEKINAAAKARGYLPEKPINPPQAPAKKPDA